MGDFVFAFWFSVVLILPEIDFFSSCCSTPREM
jgi:hypothetical protein